MHNLSLFRPERAKTLEELSKLAGLHTRDSHSYLADYERYGYISFETGKDGLRRYFLTGLGVLAACSLFS